MLLSHHLRKLVPTHLKRSTAFYSSATQDPPPTNYTKSYYLWRMDDRGSEIFIGSFETFEEADKLRETLHARGHHQTYWVEKKEYSDAHSTDKGRFM